MTATSLADLTMRTLRATSSAIEPPTGSPSFDGACSVAVCEQVTLVSGVTVPALSSLEGNVGCHQLGQRCREPLGIGILGVQDGAIIRLEDEGGGGGSDRRSQQDRSDEEVKARASQHHP